MASVEVVLRNIAFRSPRSSRHSLMLVGSAVCVLVAACGSTPAGNPVGPTSGSITTSLSPVPVTLRASSDGVSYVLSADASFRDSSGEGGRVASIDIQLVDAAGHGDLRHVTLDLTLAPGRSTTRQVSETMHVPGAQPVRVRMSTTTIDRDGATHLLTDVDAPVVIVGARPPAASPAADATFVGAGDIANCDVPGSGATARLLDTIGGDIFTLGDNVYPNGTAESFARCYEPTWGRHRGRTHPNPGNHDWDVAAGSPYFSYFGASSGPSGLGYYSFNLGAWRVLSLNSNINAAPGSAQYEWVKRDLAAAPTLCTLAYWHHPVFSSGPNGNNGQMRELWRLLDDAGVDVVLVGHDHLYERFAPQDADGHSSASGMREFIVGTGGTRLYNPATVQPNSEVRGADTWGVLRLGLHSDRYDWEFLPVDGGAFRDSGSAACTR